MEKKGLAGMTGGKGSQIYAVENGFGAMNGKETAQTQRPNSGPPVLAA